MQRQRDTLWALRGAGIITGFVLVAMLVLVVIAVVIEGFQWELLFQTLGVFRLAFPIILVCVFILAFLVLRFHIYTAIAMLLVGTFAFFLASMKTNPVSQQISEYIRVQFEVEFFAAAVTMLALAIALFEVYRRSIVDERREK